SPITARWCAISACAPGLRCAPSRPPEADAAPGARTMNDNASASWKLETDAEGIAWLTLDKPGTSANVLSGSVLSELDALLAPLEQQPPRGVVVMSAKKSGFVAGADIKEFTGITDAAS